MGRRLFGTDGVRGLAGVDVTAQLALALGRAVVLHSGLPAPRALVIRDTRESGEMLEAALAAGLASAGGEVALGGVLPTPAAPLLARRHGFDLAAVISASHNPYGDNGIKFFGADGFKLTDETEQEIELHFDEDAGSSGERIGRISELDGLTEDYLGELERRFSALSLDGLDVVLDCANGATHSVAPEIFRRLGASVTALAVSPDGRNINDRCGSTHLQALVAAIRDGGHDVGFAFDGDGDRMLAVDGAGEVVDGDELLALAALHLRESDRLGGGVVVTVMTNFGFHSAMERAGIHVVTTAVGDRYVLEAMRARGFALGGEQSGHIIELGFGPSGDGIAAALLVLEALDGADLRERAAMEKLPQRLVNVPVRDRGALAGADGVHAAIARETEALEGRGRVLVRPSGTEPLVRVMVEAPSVEETDAVCARLVAVVTEQLG
ncbi:MAG TPA: phosphoglucosamine mutase [Solirubrobacteraceae bacterium]|jgi:phosphoglucosamine mutase|nr:phosphoglucosamine mutase [Solirubrobacteraceae bacterium]